MSPLELRIFVSVLAGSALAHLDEPDEAIERAYVLAVTGAARVARADAEEDAARRGALDKAKAAITLGRRFQHQGEILTVGEVVGKSVHFLDPEGAVVKRDLENVAMRRGFEALVEDGEAAE